MLEIQVVYKHSIAGWCFAGGENQHFLKLFAKIDHSSFLTLGAEHNLDETF